MASLSIFAALRASLTSDFLYGLVNTPAQRDPPFLVLVAFTTILVAVSVLFFNSEASGLVSGMVVSFFVFCSSVLLSITVMALFGKRAGSAHIQKASYTLLSAYMFAVLLFDLNLLLPAAEPTYVGTDWPGWLAALAYSVIYPLYGLLMSWLNLNARLDQLFLRWQPVQLDARKVARLLPVAAVPGRPDRRPRLVADRSWRALVAFAVTTLFCAVMFRATIIDRASLRGLNDLVKAVSDALPLIP